MTTNYQRGDLLNTHIPEDRKGISFSSLEGSEIDNPTNVAEEIEFQEFVKGVSSADNPNEQSMERMIPPPVFRLMLQKGDVKMIPHDFAQLSSWDRKEGKSEDDYVRFATNPNFVQMESMETGYHPLPGLAGDGYKISSIGQITLPMVYYAWTGGFAISCTREWTFPGRAQNFLDTGTGDILGRRTIFAKNGTKIYRYFMRTYTIMDNFGKHNQRRSFAGAHYKMEPGLNVLRSLAATMLTAFEGERPKNYIAQHHAETWNNDPDKLDWFTISDNNKKENQKPK
jgi:hypothetical protein